VQNKEEKKNPVGRPSKYTDEMPQKLMDFFNVPLDREVAREIPTKDGVTTIIETKPGRLPTVEGFCASIPISKSTFHDWVKANPEFRNALGKCKQMQMQHLITHALEGTYNANFAKFLAQNISEYRDKIETVNENKNIEIKIDSDDSKL
jgi:hypothetical protein